MTLARRNEFGVATVILSEAKDLGRGNKGPGDWPVEKEKVCIG